MHKDLQDLGLRLVLCFLPISWIAFIFTPLTLIATALLLQIAYDPHVIGQTILVGNNTFRIIEACIASGAFYLLWLLVFVTRNISWQMRLKVVATCWAALFMVNVARIVFLIVIAQEIGWQAFDAVHLILWKFVSGIFVALIWIAAVYYYQIKSIPVYDDFMWLYRQSTLSNKKSNKNVFKGKQGHNKKTGP